MVGSSVMGQSNTKYFRDSKEKKVSLNVCQRTHNTGTVLGNVFFFTIKKSRDTRTRRSPVGVSFSNVHKRYS